ncbi:MAG: hypothetical protein Alpg2KO_26560 [Alphaproteobacteria bacterium]
MTDPMIDLAARIAPHHVQLVRHLPDGPAAPELVDESVIMLSGDMAQLEQVSTLSLAAYRVTMDWPARRLNHAVVGTAPGQQSHADPLVVFEEHGQWHLSIFLDRLPFDLVKAARLQINGHDHPLTLSAETADPAVMRSQVTRSSPGFWTLEVMAQVEIEVIWQSVRAGQSVETRQLLPAGDHALTIPSFEGEYGGIALSTAAERIGGVEHKHRMFGDMMAGSGRWFWDGETLLAPRTAHINGWVALALPTGIKMEALCLPADAPFAEPDELAPLEHQPPTLEELPDWLQDPDNQALAAPWLGASGAFAAGQQDWPEYGVAFCPPPEPDLPLQKARAHDRRRFILPNSPCATCPVAGTCNNLLPFPNSTTEQAAPAVFRDGQCRLQPVLIRICDQDELE